MTGTRTTTTSTAWRTSCALSTCSGISKTPRDLPRRGLARQATRELRALIHQANLARDQGLAAVPGDAITEHLRLFRHAVNAGLSEIGRVPGANEKQPPGRLLLECLKHREDDVLRFLTDTAIPPTSNQAERDLRPAKTQQKISGRPLRKDHQAPVRHSRFRVHRRQARTRRLHRYPRCPR